ncbi:MAG TPA: Gfo/Idh/MocA family oxidoreductase [Acidimicrobiales bacterium]|nr:Gfo/Idh/MocA family oxidoreductase [Acidimicrobiales bacterium]
MIRVGVIGLGYWGPRILRNVVSLLPAEQVIVCDSNPTRLEAALASYPGIEAADSIEEFLDQDVNGVILATPVHTHGELAQRIMNRGVDILVEKPLATSAVVARSLVDYARNHNLVLMIGHTFLYSPAVQVIRDRVLRGELGDIHYLMSTRVNLGIHQSTASVMWDLAPHDLSIMSYVLEEVPISVSALTRSSLAGQPADVAFMTLQFPSGIIAESSMSWLAPTKIRSMTFVGRQRMLVYEDTDLETPVRIYDKGVSFSLDSGFGARELSYRTGDMVAPRIELEEPLRLEVSEFIRRIESRVPPTIHEEQAVAIVATIEAAHRSAEEHGVPVDVIAPAGSPTVSV